MAVNPKSYSRRAANAFPISCELGVKKYPGDFPDGEAFLYAENVGRSTPGKSLNIDVVFRPTSRGAFAQGKEYCTVEMGFHHISNSSKNPADNPSSWRWVTVINKALIKRLTYVGSEAWSYQGVSSRPRYGMWAYNGPFNLTADEKNTIAAMSYTDMHNTLVSKGYILKNTDGSAGGVHVSGAKSFARFEPYWKCYLSNGGNYSSKSEHMPAIGGKMTYYNGVFSESQLDGGKGSLRGIAADSVAGENRYCLRITVGLKQWYWYNNEDGNNDPLGVNKVDNALLGIPDIQTDSQSREDWPPRYDAKFYISNGTKFNEVTAAGKKSNGTGWTVF